MPNTPLKINTTLIILLLISQGIITTQVINTAEVNKQIKLNKTEINILKEELTKSQNYIKYFKFKIKDISKLQNSVGMSYFKIITEDNQMLVLPAGNLDSPIDKTGKVIQVGNLVAGTYHYDIIIEISVI